ncbi:MAG: hypothetical protein A2178_01990 [Planctomycetes bacterium GWC2_49_10]|nr:MAG: hypothetical protein A2178_01990 [Planctomycetes bacterium GWC2_49_10]
MRKDLLLLVLGRFLQALLTIATLRVLTAFLLPAQVGSVYLILSIAAVFGLFLINPVGMYINRKLHSWHKQKTVFSHFYLFNLYVAGVAVLSLAAVGLGKYLFGVGAELTLLPLVLVVACYVYASTWNMTLIPALNMLGFRAPFVVFSVLTSGLALALSAGLVIRVSPTAIGWVSGQAAAMLVMALVALVALKYKLGEPLTALPFSEAKTDQAKDLWAFAMPLAGATFFMWVQNQSYRVIVERLAGPDFLGFLAVGLGISSSLAAVTESLAQQIYFPDFYKKLNTAEAGGHKTALAGLAVKTLPAYIILTVFILCVSSQLTTLLVDRKFAGAAVFVAFGAFIELFRMTANVLASSAHAEMRTSVLIKPYAAGGIFTVLGVYAACHFAGKAMLVPAAMAVGGLVTVWVLKAETSKKAFSDLDYSPLMKSAAYSSLFLLLLPFRHLNSMGWSVLLLALAGAYFLLLQYLAAFKWSKALPAAAPAAPAAGGPLVCVCMPTHNSEATIVESLESVLNQTYRNIKIIVVDNASSDNTAKIVERYAEKDHRLELIVNQENLGAENNFTRCIELASGAYTAIYHADDVYSPRMIEEAVTFLDANKETGAVFTAAEEIDSRGRTIGYREIPPEFLCGVRRSFSFDEIFRAVLLRGNFLTFPTALVRTNIYKDEIQAWNGRKYKTSADLDVWLRIAERHAIGFIDKPLLKYRVSTSSFSYAYFRLRTMRQDMFMVLGDYLKRHEMRMDTRARDDYRLLELKDDINIAINQIILNERDKARDCLEGIFRLKNVQQSFRSLGQLKYIIIGYAAWFLALLPIGLPGRKILSVIRHKG